MYSPAPLLLLLCLLHLSLSHPVPLTRQSSPASASSAAERISRARAVIAQRMREARKARAYRIALQRKERAQREAQRRKNRARLLQQAAINKHHRDRVRRLRETAKRNFLAAVKKGDEKEAAKWYAAMKASEALRPREAPPAEEVLREGAGETPVPSPEAAVVGPEATSVPVMTREAADEVEDAVVVE